MDNGMLAKLAQLLQGGNKFGGQTYGGAKMGGNTYGGNTFGASGPQTAMVHATPPALPAYQVPGSSLSDMLQMQKQQQAAPPAAPVAPAPMPPPVDPNAAAGALQATTSPTGGAPAVPPMPAPTPVGMAPGMGQQDQGMVAQILAALKARDPQLPPQMAMGQSVT